MNLKKIPIEKWIKYLLYATIIIFLNNWIQNKKQNKQTKLNIFISKKSIANIISLFIIFLICERIPSLISNSLFNGIGYSLGNNLVSSLI